MATPSTPKLGFNEVTHEYTYMGVPIPSVTQVLKAVKVTDYSDVDPAVLARKCAIGSEVHLATQFYDEDGAIGAMDPVVEPYVRAYIRFREESGFVPELVEQRLMAQIDGCHYGLTIDRSGPLNGKSIVLDLKTTASEEELAWRLQTAAYQHALGTQGRGVVHLRPDGTYKLFTYGDAADLTAFGAALKVVTWQMNNGRRTF